MTKITTNADELRDETAPLYDGRDSIGKIVIHPEERRVVAEPWSGDVTPYDEYAKLTPSLATSSLVSGEAIADFLESVEFLALAARICAGHSVTYAQDRDHTDSHRHGRLTSDARTAYDELVNLASSQLVQNVQVWDVATWVGEDHGVVADTSDAVIEAIARDLAQQAARDCVLLVGDPKKYLHQLRDEACDADGGDY
jgi:hypothetical protein